jgi:hypothetical protein
VFCHGRARFLGRDSREFAVLHDHCVRVYGQSPDEWGGAIAYVQVQPSWMVGFAFTREESP